MQSIDGMLSVFLTIITAMKHIRSTLIDQGFSEKEADVYLGLLRLGETSPQEISRISKVKRPTVYILLDNLISKGLVVKSPRGGSRRYRALSPSILLENRHNSLKKLEGILPELNSLMCNLSGRPEVSVYEGLGGIQRMMEQTLHSKTEIFYWADMELISTTAFKEYWREYIRKRVKARIFARGIAPLDRVSLECKRRHKEELRELYLISKDQYPFKMEVNIYDDKVAMISHEDLMGVIIQNQRIADTQRSIFRFAFHFAKLSESSIVRR